MIPLGNATVPSVAVISPLVLSDRLLSLAEDADRAGFRGAAEHLLGLASDVLDPFPQTTPTSRQRRAVAVQG